MADVVFDWANLPAGYCFTNPQTFMDDILGRLTGTLGTGAQVIVQDTLPGPDDQDKVWVRTNPDGTLEGVYLFQGVWHRPHPISQSSQERRIWVGTEADLWAYDGGDGTDPGTSPPTDTTGAMWEVDTDFDFRFPLGVGASDTGTSGATYNGDPATTVATGDTGGAEKVALADVETGTAEHFHAFGRMKSNAGAGGDNGDFLTGTTTVNSGAARRVRGLDDSPISVDISSDTGDMLVTAEQEIPGGATPAEAHQNMPPFKAVAFIKRTARKFITVTS